MAQDETREAARRLGAAIRSLRARRGWTQGQLALYAKVERSWISHLERGHYIEPSPGGLMRVAQALGIDYQTWFRQIGYTLPNVLREHEDLLAPDVTEMAIRVQALPPEKRQRFIEGMQVMLRMAEEGARQYPEARSEKKAAEMPEQYRTGKDTDE